jgi:AbrB family looped-hinge helix DNA binding protein
LLYFSEPDVSTVTLSSKGQIVVPKTIRTSLGVEAGDKLRIYFRDGVAQLARVPRTASARAEVKAGFLKRSTQPKLTVAQVNDAIGEMLLQQDKRTRAK